MQLRAREIIDRKYELIEQLGVGGMGEVWQAKRAHQHFALKFILPALQEDERIVDRFKSEIATAMRLRSRHVVRAHEFGVDREFGFYLVMEFLMGESLREVLARGRVENVRTAVSYALQTCEALEEAHQLGIVHRDLKPENLFLTSGPGEPLVKVLDFGIAQVGSDVLRVTQSGSFIGTRNYTSPEQFANSATVTERSDLFSLGAVLYELLCGEKAFPGETSQIPGMRPVALSSLRRELPKGLIAIVERCLERDPADRFSGADALAEVLRPFAGARPSAALGEAKTEVASPMSRKLGVSVRRVVDVGVEEATTLQRSVSLEAAAGSARPGGKFAELGAMVEAICNGKQSDGQPRRVVFMLGAGFSAPSVPGTQEFVNLIHAELPKGERVTLEALRQNSKNLYQEAFALLRQRKDTYEANRVVRRAVLRAYHHPVELDTSEAAQARQCSEVEAHFDRWTLPEGVDHLGAIIQAGLHQNSPRGPISPRDWRFSSVHLTTNFDPLLAISVGKRGGVVSNISLSRDGRLPVPNKLSCAIVHLHGRWDEGDTLHVDLNLPRPELEDGLCELLNRSTLVVVGYGGWDDIFLRTLTRAARRGGTDFNVLWGFYELDQSKIEAEQGPLIDKLNGALAPRIRFYRGIDANSLFRDLRARVTSESSFPPPASLDRRSLSEVTPPPPPPPAETPVPRPPMRDPSRHLAVGAAALLAGTLLWIGASKLSPPTPPRTPARPVTSTLTPPVAPPVSADAEAPSAPVNLVVPSAKPCPKSVAWRQDPKAKFSPPLPLGAGCRASVIDFAPSSRTEFLFHFANGTCISKGFGVNEAGVTLQACRPRPVAPACEGGLCAPPPLRCHYKQADPKEPFALTVARRNLCLAFKPPAPGRFTPPKERFECTCGTP